MTIRLLLIVAALLMLSTAGVVTLDKCVPDCTGHEYLDRVPDPWNCTQFYICIENELPDSGPHSCLNGHFDEASGNCVPGDCQSKCRVCQPDCHDHFPGDLVEDPLDCTNFYVCVNQDEPSSYPIACQPPTGVFDPQEGRCVPGNTCASSCAPAECHITCRSPSDLLASPYNCNEYYVCKGDFTLVGPVHCPADAPYFDGWNCRQHQWQCCSTRCSPFCHYGEEYVIDPKDCTKYYRCYREGTPLEADHLTCPPGTNFQPWDGRCVLGAPCLALCANASTTTTPISTITPPTFTTTVTTSTSTTATDCVPFLTCPDSGNYPMCESCNRGYFQCQSAGAGGVPSLCDEGFLFNTDASYRFCVRASHCPYTPPPYRVISKTDGQV